MEIKSIATNSGGHLYDGSKYAHFSQITDHNKERFPLFQKATPISIRVEKGESLVIPKGWWHHVKSFGSRCISVNFWYDNGSAPSLSSKPIKIQNAISKWKALERWTNEYLIEKIDGGLPYGVWLVLDKFACRKPISVADFVAKYSDRKEYAYLITPTDFENLPNGSSNNKRILEILSDDFEIPFPQRMLNADANFWMNFGGLDTGLHFDDEDGLLCVVEGYKEVLLYDPNDTPYLYPYPAKPIELEPSYEQFFYNLYKKGPKLDTTIAMSSLLQVCMWKAPNVARIAKLLQEKYGIGKIVYGVKNTDGVVRYEFYFYGIHTDFDREVNAANFYKDDDHNSQWELSKYMEFHKELFPSDVYDISKVESRRMCIFSIDLTEEDVIFGRTPNLNLYYTPDETINLPFLLFEKTYHKDATQEIRCVVSTASYKDVFATGNVFANKCVAMCIEIHDVLNIVEFLKITNFPCSVLSIFNKGTQVGLYFYGVQFQAFLDFLDEYDYPSELTAHCLKNQNDLKKMNLEIGFHFEKGSNSGKPLRTAFYGVF
jgi:hypothetical protein